jgi:hypothetical protein
MARPSGLGGLSGFSVVAARWGHERQGGAEFIGDGGGRARPGWGRSGRPESGTTEWERARMRRGRTDEDAGSAGSGGVGVARTKDGRIHP